MLQSSSIICMSSWLLCNAVLRYTEEKLPFIFPGLSWWLQQRPRRLSQWMIIPLACVRWNRDWGIFLILICLLYFRCLRQHASTTASSSCFWRESANATLNCVQIGSAHVWQMTKPASWVTASVHLVTASAAPLARFTFFQQILSSFVDVFHPSSLWLFFQT